MTDELDALAARLVPHEVERIIGWQGCGGAAYNAVSSCLCKLGVLSRDWTLTPLGLALRERLIEKNNAG